VLSLVSPWKLRLLEFSQKSLASYFRIALARACSREFRFIFAGEFELLRSILK
jgi:hypothetical protein